MKILTYEGSEVGYPVGKHMDDAINYIENVLPHLHKIIKKKDVNLWCRGSSGAILAALITAKTTNICTILHVKKDGEDSHTGNYFSRSSLEGKINVIIDDFSCTGNTINSIFEKVIGVSPKVDVLILSSIHSGVRLNFEPKYFITPSTYIEPAKNSIKHLKHEKNNNIPL